MSEEKVPSIVTQEPPQGRYAKIFAHFPAEQPSKLENFFIDDETCGKIAFREDLPVMGGENVDGEIGSVTINITRLPETEPLFQVRAAAEATMGSVRCGSTSLSCVDRHFRTLQERRTEYAVPLGDSLESPVQQSMYLVQEQDGYYVSVSQRHGEDEEHVDKEVSFLPPELAKHVISEGAYLLLLRYLAITGFAGEFDALTVLLDGKPRITSYTASGLIKEQYNGADALMEVVSRKIQTSKWDDETMTTVLSAAGQEVRHLWHGWSCFYSLQPYQQLERKISPTYGVGVVTPLQIGWEDDMQMRSRFLDRKEERYASHRSYLLDNAVIRNMISDFVQELLLFKPDDVLPFALHHFSSYCFDYEADPAGSSEQPIVDSDSHYQIDYDLELGATRSSRDD